MFPAEVRQRDVREALRNGAIDLYDLYKKFSYTDFLDFCHEREMRCVARSYGEYGINGVICVDNQRVLYACPARGAVVYSVMDM